MTDDKIVTLTTRPKKTNAETIRLLKEWLADAESGELQEIAMAGLHPDGTSQSCASSSDNVQSLLGAIEILKYRMLDGYIENSPTDASA